MSHLDTAAVTGVLGLVAGLVVPTLIGRLPEPEVEAEDSARDGIVEGAGEVVGEGEGPKELYVDIAAAPYLTLQTVVTAGLAGGLLGWSLGWVWPLLFLVPLVPVAVLLSVVDRRTRLLPSVVIAPAYVLSIVLVWVCFALTRDTDDLTRAGLGGAIGGGLFFLLWAVPRDQMGFGDVRLAGVMGIVLGYLGWGPLVVGLYAGFLLGAVDGGLLSVLRTGERRSFAFGPYMLAGALLGVVVGEPVWSMLATSGS